MKLGRWWWILHRVNCHRIIITATTWWAHLFLFNMRELLFEFGSLRWVWGLVRDHLEYVSDLSDLQGFSLTKAQDMGVVEFLRGYHSECQHYWLNSFVFNVQVLAVRKHFSFIKSLISFSFGSEKFMHRSVPLSEYGNQFILEFGEIFQLF